jgi:toxin ParE1/3/4
MTSTYRVTPRAREDLKKIGRYTPKTWGREQCDSYLRAMEARFAWLTQHPNLGKNRTDVQDGYYRYPQGAHVVFYLRREGGIDIIGIPHQRMDVMNYFSGDSALS